MTRRKSAGSSRAWRLSSASHGTGRHIQVAAAPLDEAPEVVAQRRPGMHVRGRRAVPKHAAYHSSIPVEHRL